ncbi:MAG: acylphosphatase [Methanospirillaceae archaeon]|nr:acylphosphatase [Methanospirillaceae archaeon]
MDNRFLRLNLRISGSLQRVGYRHIVQDIARRHHVTGSIRNLEGYDVEVIAEGTVDDVTWFKNAIKIEDCPIFVESIEITEGRYTGEYSYFEVLRGSSDEELAERFDTAIGILSRMEKKQDTALGIHTESLGLQKETISLQNEAISLQKETLSLQNETISLQKETISLQNETLDEIKGTRQDLDKILSKELAEMREEVREIRSALIQIGVLHCAKS